MPTIVVKKSTAEELQRLMQARQMESLDQTINFLIESAARVPGSMFGADKNRRIRLTKAEHKSSKGERRPEGGRMGRALFVGLSEAIMI